MASESVYVLVFIPSIIILYSWKFLMKVTFETIKDTIILSSKKFLSLKSPALLTSIFKNTIFEMSHEEKFCIQKFQYWNYADNRSV